MLFTRRALDGLADGTIDLAFRRWRRPAARPGGTQRTRIGVLAIDSVERVSRADIREADAVRAGFASRAALLNALDKREGGSIYRIELHLAGPDPRIELRERDALTDGEVAGLAERLRRLDAAARDGAWTRDVLALIARRPGVRAPDLAAQCGRDVKPFKRDVRKLKELGLTESLPVGYRLSPRGRALRERLRQSGARAETSRL